MHAPLAACTLLPGNSHTRCQPQRKYDVDEHHSCGGEEGGESCVHHGGDAIELGAVRIRLLHTPGHTPGSQCFLVEEEGQPGRLVSGDTLFLNGCGRVDLPGGDPEALYRSQRSPLAPGARISLSGLEARIGSVDAKAAPLRVELRFPEPLTHERFVFLALRGDVYEPVLPGELARRPVAAAPPIAELLTRSHVRAAFAQAHLD